MGKANIFPNDENSYSYKTLLDILKPNLGEGTELLCGKIDGK